MKRGGTTYRYITDPRGSVRLLIDTSTATVTQRLDYSPYGRVLQRQAPRMQPFGFAGGLWDRQTGLVRFGARDYEAGSGRWASKDPIRFQATSPNLYGYVLKDPVNNFDPAGLQGVARPAVGPGAGNTWLGGAGAAAAASAILAGGASRDAAERLDNPPIKCEDREPDPCRFELEACIGKRGFQPKTGSCFLCFSQCKWQGRWPDSAMCNWREDDVGRRSSPAPGSGPLSWLTNLF